MSFYLLSDSEESWQRTLVYQTMYESYVVFIQQYKDFSEKNWITSDRFIIPKPIIDFVATLPGKNLPAHGSIITSGGLVPPQQLQSCEPQDIATLPDETKQLLFKYDCDCVPLFENQLGAQDARDNLASLWGIQLSPTSPSSSSGQSLPTTPLSDPSATTTPQSSSPSFFAALSRDQVPWIFGIGTTSQETPDTTMLSEANFESPKTPVPESDGEDKTITPNNLETPKVCRAPKKRKSDFNLSVLFED